MSANKIEEDNPSALSSESTESPAKSARMESSSRKSWSLMDRRTDHEVLQEMGVSLLDPDENDPMFDAFIGVNQKPTLKRKRDIENVNPNINSGSPRKSPKGSRSPLKTTPSPGPSKVKSPKSGDKHKYQQTDQSILETTLQFDYLIDEETPLAQLVEAHIPAAHGSAGKRVRTCTTPLGLQEELIINRRTATPTYGVDSFAALSDEMLLSIFRWLPKLTLTHCMLVCKRWYRVACDETLWQRLDLGNKTLCKDALGRILDRKPIIIRLANSEIGEWHPTTSITPSRIQYLDLSIVTTDRQTLNSLLIRCPLLKKLSLESVPLEDSTCEIIGKFVQLETLNLTMAQGITARGLTFMLKGLTSLKSLNISWCKLSTCALQVLVSTLDPKILRLNLAGARLITDEMVMSLVSRCSGLVELDLSDCSHIGCESVLSVAGLTRLEHLALSRCYLLPPHVLTKLNSMPSLQYLEVWGMLQSSSLSALRAALPSILINQFMFSAIARPTVGTRRTSIWGLRTRDQCN